jgi:hypothetical protein
MCPEEHQERSSDACFQVVRILELRYSTPPHMTNKQRNIKRNNRPPSIPLSPSGSTQSYSTVLYSTLIVKLGPLRGERLSLLFARKKEGPKKRIYSSNKGILYHRGKNIFFGFF